MMKITRNDLKVSSSKHSETGDGTPLNDLNFKNWWTDTSKGLHYLHVENKNGETFHRVYCKRVDCPRLMLNNGELYWIITA
jgi:hypothetical protein